MWTQTWQEIRYKWSFIWTKESSQWTLWKLVDEWREYYIPRKHVKEIETNKHQMTKTAELDKVRQICDKGPKELGKYKLSSDYREN